MAELSAVDQAWQDWFATQEIAPLTVTYDQISADPQGVLSRILGRLGVDQGAANGISPAVSKLADATNRVWADRFIAEPGDKLDPLR